MHILVTNDDGVTAPGLLALAQTMRILVMSVSSRLIVIGQEQVMSKPSNDRSASVM
ncbi:MAG: 5'/3'-nucleotidase SurE [Candidatus Promineifilaceae bacterium]|jgi:broad specificity polyphosphatase/5'/3'-nucleotidase SurE